MAWPTFRRLMADTRASLGKFWPEALALPSKVAASATRCLLIRLLLNVLHHSSPITFCRSSRCRRRNALCGAGGRFASFCWGLQSLGALGGKANAKEQARAEQRPTQHRKHAACTGVEQCAALGARRQFNELAELDCGGDASSSCIPFKTSCLASAAGVINPPCFIHFLLSTVC